MGEVGCLKDGHFQNLLVEGTTILDNHVPIHTLTGVATTGVAITKEMSGGIIYLNMSTASTLAYLPAATVGLNYRIILSDDSPVKGSAAAIKAGPAVGEAGIQAFYGQLLVFGDFNMDGALTQGVQQVGAPTYDGTSDLSQDFISLGKDGTTIGGEAGNVIDVKCLSTGIWHVNGILTTSASLAENSSDIAPIGGTLNTT